MAKFIVTENVRVNFHSRGQAVVRDLAKGDEVDSTDFVTALLRARGVLESVKPKPKTKPTESETLEP